MKPIYYLICMFPLLVNCQTKKIDGQETTNTTKEAPIKEVTQAKEVAPEKDKATIFIKDSSDYSSNFLAALEKSGMPSYALIDSFLIIESDTIPFPAIPKMGKKTVLTAKKETLAIALTIQRVNQTTLDYRLEMVEFGKASFHYKGQADLSSYFYLATEMDESSLSGMTYSSIEFSDGQDACHVYIRLGKEEGRPHLLGKLIKNCNGKLRTIDLSNFPTLVEK